MGAVVETAVAMADEDDRPKFVFRNYRPHNEDLKKFVVEPPAVPDLEKELVEMCLEQVQADEAAREGQLTIQPRKANWDLKRDVAKKLEKLEKRTQQAVFELIRDKIASQQSGADHIDLASAVDKETALSSGVSSPKGR